MHTTLHTDSFSNLPRVEVAPLKATVTMPGMVRSTEEVDIKGRQALMSEDGKCFGVHSTGYKVVQHEDLFNRFKEYLLDRIGEYAEDYKQKVLVSHGGARAYAVWEFPKLAFDILTPNGFKTNSTLIVYCKNSHDGAWSPTGASGLMDFFCENMEMGGEWKLFRGKHTSGFTIDKFLAPQVNWISTFREQRNRQITQAYTPCGIYDAEKFVLSIPKFSQKAKDSDGEPLEVDGVAVLEPNRLGNSIMDRFHKESEMRGHNLFSLSSALTYYASHDSEEFPHRKRASALYSGSKEMANIVKRSEEVRDIINTHPLFKVAA